MAKLVMSVSRSPLQRNIADIGDVLIASMVFSVLASLSGWKRQSGRGLMTRTSRLSRAPAWH